MKRRRQIRLQVCSVVGKANAESNDRIGSKAAQSTCEAASSEMRRIAELIQGRSLDAVSTASGQFRNLDSKNPEHLN